MGKLVLAGTGHAHLPVIAAIGKILADGHSVVGINSGEMHYYSGMGPGMLGGVYRPEEIRFPVRRMIERRGATFVKGRVTFINAPERTVVLESGQRISYDVLSCNLGSEVSWSTQAASGKDVFPVKPIENLYAARERILSMAGKGRVRVGVCGGGPAAVEIAGNAHAAGKKGKGGGCRVQVFSAGPVLGGMPGRARRMAQSHLVKEGIEIFSGHPVLSVESGAVRLENEAVYPQGIVFLATGIRPPKIFTESKLETSPDGGLLVNRFLQSPAFPEIFGGGDCISFAPRPLARVGVHAVRQGPVLMNNLLARLNNGRLCPFEPQADYLVILNLGGGYGIFSRGAIRFGGRSAFWIKDFIDKTFMRKYRE